MINPKRKIILFFIIVFFSCANKSLPKKETEDDNNLSPTFQYPELKTKGHIIANFIPKGWLIFDTIRAHINEDNIIDYAIVLETTNKVKFMRQYESMQYEVGKPRILAILLSQSENKLLLSVQSNTIMLTSQEGGMMGDPYQGLYASKGQICTQYWGGSRSKWNLSHCFKFLNGRWILVTVENSGGNSMLLESGTYDFETGKFNYEFSEEEYFEEKDSISVIKSEKYSKIIKMDTVITIDKFRPWTLEIDKKMTF